MGGVWLATAGRNNPRPLPRWSSPVQRLAHQRRCRAGCRRVNPVGDALERVLSAGEVSDWIRLRDGSLAALPNEPCKWCNGTGVRADKVGAQFGHPSRVVGATTTVKGA